MSGARIVAELATAAVVAMAFVRFLRQLVALAVAVTVSLSVIGLMTVISWFDALPWR
jgi:hypothetical protein